MKKLLSVLLVLALAVSMVGFAAAEENVTLTVMIYDRGNTTNTYGTVTDNYWTRWVQTTFGDPNGITVKYVPVPRANDGEKVNTMMAGGTAPDIIFSYDSTMIMNFGKNGGLTELSGLIAQYGPNITENMADAFAYGKDGDNMWALPAMRSSVGRYATFMREDWLEKMNYTLKTDDDGLYHISVEDFDALLHQAKDLDLDNTGMTVYPLGVIGAYSATQSRPIIYAFVNRAELTDEMRACYDEMFWPGYKEGVRYLNKLYNEGLIDPDFMVDTDTSYTSFSSLLTNGRMLAYGHDCGYTGAVEALYASNPEANVVPVVLENIYGEQFVDVYAPTGMYIAVPATCKNPEAAVKYLNFLADYDTYNTLAYGFEGVHYTVENGVVTSLTGSMTTEEKLVDTANEYERLTVGDMALCYNGSPLGWVTSTEGMEPIKARVTEMSNDAWKIAAIGGSAPYYFQGIRTDAQEEYDGFLPGLTSNLPALIACSADEFDAAYDKVLNDYLAAGGQAVIDAQVALYRQLEGIAE